MNDTIAAIATPAGVGGVGIIRISGKNAKSIAEKITHKQLKPRVATYSEFKNQSNKVVDSGIIIYFHDTHSYTGEDTVEFQGHGGIYVLQSVLQLIISHGARPAKPGEFTERAFLNDKIDLIQAEAVADLIESRSQSATNAALKSLSGDFSAIINNLQEKIITLRVFVEASLDFSDEEIDFLSEGNVKQQIQDLTELVQSTIDKASYGKLLQNGVQIVLVGSPNAGKSSLMNKLLGQDRAIVTEQAGTTRDTLEETLLIKDIPVRIIDTAGLRETNDAIEIAGIDRAKQAIKNADFALWLRDSTCLSDSIPTELERIDYIEIFNKSDLLTQDDFNTRLTENIHISAKTGQGIEELLEIIANNISDKHNEEGVFSARERHIQALQATQQHIQNSLIHIQSLQTSELIAEELRLAQQQLSEITGEYRTDDLLGDIFSSFCIGK